MTSKIYITEKQFKLITEFSNSERNIIRIVESRGMFTNYDNIIGPIVRYVNNYIKANEPDSILTYTLSDMKLIPVKRYIVYIPDDITNTITWVENKIIKIIVYDLKGKYVPDIDRKRFNNSNEGLYSVPSDDKLTKDGKLNEIRILVKSFSIDGEVISQNLYSTLYHEVTHAFENYNRLKKNGNGLNHYFNTTKYDEIANSDESDDDDETIKFKEINYYIFSNVEKNANVAGVYGDLERLNSKRENFSTDIKETYAYQLYEYVKYDVIPMLGKLDNSYWEKFKDIAFTTNKINQSTGRFKSDFIKSANYKLNDLLRGIGKVASQYYDDSEMKNNQNNKKALFK